MPGTLKGELLALRPKIAKAAQAIYDAWGDICTDLGLTVSIDVVAGTSAGGLNGTLLATAIARGAPLPNLQEVWRDVAQLDDTHLLRPPTHDESDDPALAASVLSGTFFDERVDEVFASVGRDNTPSTAPQDITLFVTSTVWVAVIPGMTLRKLTIVGWTSSVQGCAPFASISK